MSENTFETTAAVRRPVDFSRLILGTLVVLLGAGNVLLYYAATSKESGAPAPKKAAKAVAPPADTKPLADLPVVNGHDHLYREEDLQKYLDAAAELGVKKTLFVASSDFTLKGGKFSPKEGNEANSRMILKVAQAHPEQVIPFVTFHPEDANKLELMKEYLTQGAKGVKLYTGHGNFYDRPLLAPEMLDFYAFCEQMGVVLCWHINLNQYEQEFQEVMAKYPKLKVVVPHFGVGFFKPGGAVMETLGKMMETYPGLYTDCSFGTRDILVSGLEKVSASPQVFREYFEKYQDRIVWGTDMVITGNKEKSKEWIASTLRACRDMLEKSEYYYWMAADGTGYSVPNQANPYGHLTGLNLPEPILKKVYYENLQRLLGN